MDLHLLEYFVRVVELGSINKAAASLHISQPALSRHIAALEHEMKTALFTRTRGGVQVTDAGRLLSDRVRPLLRQFTMLKEQVGEHAAGLLSIGIPPAWHHLLTVHFVERLTAHNPGISLRMYEGVSNVLREYMFGRLLDLAIVPYDHSPIAGYAQTSLVREPLVIVGPARSALRMSKPAPLACLDGLKLVMPGKPNVARVQVEHALERKGMHFRLLMESDTLALCLSVARSGIGHTVVPASSLYRPRVLNEGISWAPIKGQYVTWALLENSGRSHSLAVRTARKLLIAIITEALRLQVWPGAEAVDDSMQHADITPDTASRR